ncbi:hypothetical protein, partial [Providencia rettgeri]|uniref:hypothetical protein n=1 Tax=Providencia rettgeri TaxID=587 RepID=UPI003017F8F9
LLKAWGKITLPPSLAHLRDYDEWKRFILNQGKNKEGNPVYCVYDDNHKKWLFSDENGKSIEIKIYD